MGLGHGAGEVPSGLIYWYDAANTKSFAGTGTTMSSFYSEMSLVNGYTFVGSGSSSAISLTGTNAYTITQTNLYSYFPDLSETMFIWAKSTGAGNIVSELGQTTINASWHDSNIEITAGGVVSMSVWHGSLTNKVVGPALSFNTWYSLGWTYDGTTFTGYVNGYSIGTTTFTRQRNGSALHYTIGGIDTTNMGTSGYWAGVFSNFQVYNRALTANEMLALHRATKGRYGL
jgi:hypothetical protein